MRALPMLIGRMQDQQISVIGLGNLPVQVAAPAARLGPARGEHGGEQEGRTV
jgi:hypothetical protein